MSAAAVVDCRPEHELLHREEIAALHDEVDRLPQILRPPIVLCYLEGLTHDEAARRLRWPVGTVRSRMARGRNVLEARLTRRGLAFGAIAAAIEARRAAMAAVPQALAGSTARLAIALATGAATGPVSPEVVALIEEVLMAMFITKLRRVAAAAFAALCVATAAAGIVGVGQATNPARTDVKQQVRQSAAKQSPRGGDSPQRARELIYFFRDYRVFTRDEQWAQTVRELATIGKAAVPELIAELDRAERDVTIRSVVFVLRAIDDPRAVPALIRAIPKALLPRGSDCGINIADPELRAFMKANQSYRSDGEDFVAFGRPVNEIFGALERITKHREPEGVGDKDPLRHVFRGGAPDQQLQQFAMFAERQQLWQAWWSKHWQEFATREELQSAELPKRSVDLVARDGLARIGPLFPTGANVRLGPVRMVRLTRSDYRNGKSHLDFDTGRIFEDLEGINTPDSERPDGFGQRVHRWYHRNGIDVHCEGLVKGLDLQVWVIDAGRWDTLEAEIQKDGPLELGREVISDLTPFGDELATFLFTTREGGRGIVQVFPKDPATDQYRIRYRKWETAPQGGSVEAPSAGRAALAQKAKSPGTPFGKTVTTTLERPAEGREFALDFQSGRKAVPPKFLKRDEIPHSFSLARNERFSEWCREQRLDVLYYVNLAEREAAAAPKRKGQVNHFGLMGIDMTAARILPQSFDELTVEDAREILQRVPERKPKSARLLNFEKLAERPDTYAFKTRAGTVGLLQFEPSENEAGEMTIRYKLEQRN